MDPDKSCSKYRCESLGAACKFYEYDSETQEYYVCLHDNPGDVSPPLISPSYGTISPGEKYTDVADNSFRIASLDGGCLEASNTITFGVDTDEHAICKYGEEMMEFEEMENFGPQFYILNHTMPFYVEDPTHGVSQGLDYDDEIKLYVKCHDPNGNFNHPEFYTIDMCINQGPDTTPPIIVKTIPEDGSFVGYEDNETWMEIITNEFSTCKWDIEDRNYESMANEFICSDEFGSPSSVYGYSCYDLLPLSSGSESLYFIKCADQPWLEETSDAGQRNFMDRSKIITLNRPENMIRINSILPSEDFVIGSDAVTVNFEVRTNGGVGEHQCLFSFTGYDSLYGTFQNEESGFHTREINLFTGEYSFFVRCTDEIGDSSKDRVSFEITRDERAPTISRVWNDFGEIFIITTEDSECSYSENSCNFNFENGTSIGSDRTHIINAEPGKEYYVKCKDEFGNIPGGCSIIVEAV